MFHVKQANLVHWGVDYLRWTVGAAVTEEILDNNRRVLERAWHLVSGGEAVKWERESRMGYAGASCGPIFWGLSPHQGALWQASGLASEYVIGPLLLWDNCSRIDLQTTLQYADEGIAGEMPGAVARGVAAWRDEKRGRGKALSVRLIDGFGGGDTAYVGARTSELFVRVYDKFRESGNEVYRGCVRFEAELKGTRAVTVLETLINVGDLDVAIPGILMGLLRERGIEMPECAGATRAVQMAVPREKTSDERRLTWLSTQVRPSVEKLIAGGIDRGYILGLLGLSD